MDGHLTAWRTHRVLVFLYLVAALALGAWLYRAGRSVSIPSHYLFSIGSLLPVLVVFHALAARGSRLRQTWARLASLAMGIALLFVFPVGTIFGGILIAACRHPWPDPRAHVGAPRGGWAADTGRKHSRSR